MSKRVARRCIHQAVGPFSQQTLHPSRVASLRTDSFIPVSEIRLAVDGTTTRGEFTSRRCSTSRQTMAPSHPLRRLSTGSLSSLHRSQDRHHASPSGLDFLSPAFQALNDEAAMLEKNVQQLNELHDALGTFNESFAGWLYALKMNAFCVEWPQASRCFAFAQGMFADDRHRMRSLSLDCKHWVSICRASNPGPS